MQKPVIVESIRSTKNKEGFSSLMLRQKVDVKPNLTSVLLGGSNFENKGKIAFHTISDDVLDDLNIKEGDDLSEVLGRELRIKIEEFTESELASIENTKGFRVKINPSTNESLTKDGELIYMKTSLIDILEDSSKDRRIKHNGSIAVDNDNDELINEDEVITNKLQA